jgi:hypothetical protein
MRPEEKRRVKGSANWDLVSTQLISKEEPVAVRVLWIRARIWFAGKQRARKRDSWYTTVELSQRIRQRKEGSQLQTTSKAVAIVSSSEILMCVGGQTDR